jgi:hypothetical protein
MSRFVAILAFSCIPILPAQAQSEATPAEEVLMNCKTQIAASDLEALTQTVAKIRSWKEIEDEAIRMGAEFCLEIASTLLGESNTTDTENEEDQSSVIEEDPRLIAYLQEAEAENADMADIVSRIAQDDELKPGAGPSRDALETAIMAYARPIPAAQAQTNLTAYSALARLDPTNETYVGKVKQYTDALHATGRRVLNSLRTTTEAFDGSSWSRHPSSPRYQDIRNYVTLYLLDDGKGNKSLELFLNYTSRDGWLFVKSARLNLDGEELRVPVGRWFRDNDTEIWEFASVIGPRAEELAQKIASADRAVVRFYGQEFYDDHVITSTEKKVLREMLAAWRYLEATSGSK